MKNIGTCLSDGNTGIIHTVDIILFENFDAFFCLPQNDIILGNTTFDAGLADRGVGILGEKHNRALQKFDTAVQVFILF